MSSEFVPTEGEEVIWQGRPAPRCYVFLKWKQGLLGLMLFLLSSFWLMLGWQLVEDGHPAWILALPLPLIIGSFLFGPWQLLSARLKWPGVFYALTDKRLWTSDSEALELVAVARVRVRYHGERLASLRLESQERQLVLRCIEQPQTFLRLLRERCPKILFDPAFPPE